MEIAYCLIRLLRAGPLLQCFSKLSQHLIISQPPHMFELSCHLFRSFLMSYNISTHTFVAAGPNSSVPARTQSLIFSPASKSDAAVCAAMPSSGSLNIRSVAACHINRLTICSVSGVCAAISANETRPPAGMRLAISKRASAWSQAALSLYSLTVSVVNSPPSDMSICVFAIIEQSWQCTSLGSILQILMQQD